MNYGDAIHEKLMLTARNFDFPTLSYEVTPVGGRRQTASMTTVKPAGVLAFQEGASFGVPVSDRRKVLRERQRWVWLLDVRFDRAVSVEEFEELLQASPPVVDRAPAEGRVHLVRLLLEDAVYQNPTTQQPSQGTRVTYRLNAELTPS